MIIRMAVLLMILAPIGECGGDRTPPLQKQELLYPRFQVIGQASGIALDTKTGLLCHTFNEDLDSISGGKTANLLPGQHLLNSIPFCIDLSQNETETIKPVLEGNQLGLEFENK